MSHELQRQSNRPNPTMHGCKTSSKDLREQLKDFTHFCHTCAKFCNKNNAVIAWHDQHF